MLCVYVCDVILESLFILLLRTLEVTTKKYCNQDQRGFPFFELSEIAISGTVRSQKTKRWSQGGFVQNEPSHYNFKIK